MFKVLGRIAQVIGLGVGFAVSWPIAIAAMLVVAASVIFWHAPAEAEMAYYVLRDMPRGIRAVLLFVSGFLGAWLVTISLLTANRRRIAARVSRVVMRFVGIASATTILGIVAVALAQRAKPNEVAYGSHVLSRWMARAIYSFEERTRWFDKKFSLPKVSAESITEHRLMLPTVVYDADDREVGCFAKEYRIFRSLDEVERTYMVRAILASEDAGFYEHGGFDLLGITRAAIANVVGGRIESGASTLTMQMVKNVFLTSEKSYVRKIREIVLSTQIEHVVNKRHILELYINFIFLGGGYGIEAAAQSYFGKRVEDLSLAQAALIAGLINQPNIVQAQGERGLERALARKDRVLVLMRERGMINPAEFAAARAEKVEPKRFVRACEKTEPFLLQEVNRQIGIEGKTAIAEAGLKVYTTIVKGHQTALEDGCTEALKAYIARHPEHAHTVRCQALSAEIATGHIVAFVPGQDPTRDQWSGITQSERQAGSVFKPILYAAYLEKRLKDELARREAFCRETEDAAACKVRWEAPFDLAGEDCAVHDTPTPVPAVVGWKGRIVSRHTVKNYPYGDGRPQHRGAIPCTLALAESRNAAAMWTLGQLSDAPGELARWRASEDALVSMAKRLGIKSDLRHLNVTGNTEAERAERIPNYTLAIGSAEVKLWELAEAFMPLINGGYAQPLTLFRKVTDPYEKIIADSNAKTKPVRILSPEVALGSRTLLEAVVDEEIGTAHSLRRENNFPEGALCGKTGTATNADGSSTDNWFVGCSATHLVAVRINNESKTPLGRKETGGRNALPVFTHYAKKTGIVKPESTFPVIETPVRPLPVGFTDSEAVQK